MQKTLRQTLTSNYTNTKKGYRTIGGKRHYYKSRWEANMARFLEWAKEQGTIVDWKYEDKIFWFEKIRRGTRSYVPDFRVYEVDGTETFYEVKGYWDKRSLTKMKRMRIYYPEVRILTVSAKEYNKIAAQMKPILASEWEQ